VDPADRLEQPQVRSPQPLGVGEGDEDGRARVLLLVHRVPEAGHEPLRLPGGADGGQRDVVPAAVGPGEPAVGPGADVGEDVGEEAAAVLGDAEEP